MVLVRKLIKTQGVSTSMPNLFYLLLAGISGAAMALQGTLNGALGKALGVWESTLLYT